VSKFVCQRYYSAAGSVVIYYNNNHARWQGQNATFARFLLKYKKSKLTMAI
jgi:hypothetical protein